jgi:hypothetical protein
MEMEHIKTSVLVGGQSRLPKDQGPNTIFEAALQVDLHTGKVTEASFGPCLPITSEFLTRLITGMSIKTDLEEIQTAIDLRLTTRIKKAIIAAIRDAARNYEEAWAPQSDSEITDAFETE